MSSSPAEIRRFIKNLNVGPVQRSEAGRTLREAESYVDFSVVQTFVKDVPKQQQDDLLNALLLASLAASKRIDRFEHPYQWYAEFVNILNTIGVIIPSPWLNELSPSEIGSSLYETVTNTFGRSLGPEKGELIGPSIEVLPCSPNEKADALFTSSGSSGKISTFQFGSAEVDRNLNIQASLGCYYLVLGGNIDNLASLKYYKLAVSCQYSSVQLTYNKNIADMYREAIRQKLGGYVEDNIVGIEF